MTPPNMATLTASLERSLQNFSLNHTASDDVASSASGMLIGPSSSSSSSQHRPGFHPFISSDSSSNATTTLVELNSHLSLPYNWEQCLDLKTGEIYYMNWRSGIKVKEDPRLNTSTSSTTTTGSSDGDHYYPEDDEEEDEDEDDYSYDSEGSSTTEYSPPSSSKETYRIVGKAQLSTKNHHPDDVLVVAGCKSCLMYYMVPKHVLDCPKCTGHLLHLDRSQDPNPSLSA